MGVLAGAKRLKNRQDTAVVSDATERIIIMTKRELTGYPSIDRPWMKYYSAEAINDPLPKCTIYELLLKNNENYLNDIALNYYGQKFTYGQLFTHIEQVARAFSALGTKAGDIVVICAVNTPEMVFVFYALNRLGAIANMVDPRTNIDGLREYIKESDANIVFTVDLAYPAIKKAIKGTSVKQIITVSPAASLPQLKQILYHVKNKSQKFDTGVLEWKDFLSLGTDAVPVYAPYIENTCCIMAHTGGTTGVPKTVMLSNDNVNAVTHGYQHLGIPFKRQQRYFNDLPPFIMYGLCLAVHTTLSCGLEVILYPVFDSKNFPKQFVKYKPHHFAALADHLKYLATDNIARNIDLSNFITAAIGGDSVSCELELQVNEYLRSHGCKYEVVKGYGMTELAATAVSSCHNANAIGCVGIPLVSNTIKIVEPDTRKELGFNQVGEIYISGPSIMLGYYKNKKETSETIVLDENGVQWIRTGDLGYINHDGLLFHKGRIRRIYMTTYEGQPAKIFPILVEDVINHSLFVSECSVVGRKRKNSHYYEAVVFIVKKNMTLSDEQVRKEVAAICKENVPTYMIPAEYYFVDEIPHTPIGKVDFRKLEWEAGDIRQDNSL